MGLSAKQHTQKQTMKRIINDQEFTRIKYNDGQTTWYPTENLPWLSERCAFDIL